MSIVDKLKSIKNRRVPTTLMVKSVTNITPNMRRVTLQGEGLTKFPENSEGAYIKLLFDQVGSNKPAIRTYTIAEHRSAQNEIDVDFMLHGLTDGSVKGIAAPWSLNTEAGNQVSVAGPGPAKFINTDADYFLLAADMTALPALTANLKRLPEHAKGQAFIEVLSADDKQNLIKPVGVELKWVINEDAGSDESPLFDALKQADFMDGKIAAWVACEFKTMKKIRHHLKNECNIEKTHLYVSSYWKHGDTEDQHKAAKQADAKQAG